MKNKIKYLASVLLIGGYISTYAQAPQDPDAATNIIRFNLEEKDITVKAGGRLSFDGAHYINDRMDMSSGVQIGEARLNLFASFGAKYDVKLDIDFAQEKIYFKDAFARWNINANNSLRVGHYIMPFSMDRSASTVDQFLMTPSATVNALTLARRVGVSYRSYNNFAWAEGGVFAGAMNKMEINSDRKGDDGWGITTRAIFNPKISDDLQLHLGAGLAFRTPDPNGFKDGDDDFNRIFNYSSTAETPVDNSKLINANIEYAKNELKYNVEFLMVSKKFFLQSEYTGVNITRKRDNQKLFEDQLGGMWSHQTLEDWEKWFGKDLRDISFNGIYVQAGFLLRGEKYKYDRFQAINTPCKDKGALEVIARFNHTNLNDVDGIWYNGKFYDPNKGIGVDNPNYNYSIGGGRLNSYALGFNYYFNKYARLMLNYGYQSINSFTLEDKYAHVLQTRLQISF